MVAEAGGSFKINAWQWKPIVEIAGRAGIVDDETLERMNYNADAPVTAAQADLLAAAIDEVVATMVDDSRRMLDGRVTSEPDDGRLHREDLTLNYSIPRARLQELAAFCRASRGFVVS